MWLSLTSLNWDFGIYNIWQSLLIYIFLFFSNKITRKHNIWHHYNSYRIRHYSHSWYVELKQYYNNYIHRYYVCRIYCAYQKQNTFYSSWILLIDVTFILLRYPFTKWYYHDWFFYYWVFKCVALLQAENLNCNLLPIVRILFNTLLDSQSVSQYVS